MKSKHSFIIFLLFFVVMILGAGFNPVQAAAQRCHSIDDRDLKNLCLGVTEKRSSLCRSINSIDTRYFCLAYVDKNVTRCYSIRNKDSRNICLALTDK